MTVSNIASPILVMADRFLIGARASTGVLAYYSAPLEMVTKLMIVPGVGGELPVPRVCEPRRAEDHSRLYVRGLVLTCVAVFPPLIAVLAFAPEILRLWLGPTFAAEARACFSCSRSASTSTVWRRSRFTLDSGRGPMRISQRSCTSPRSRCILPGRGG